MTPAFCSNCGSKLSDDNKFCHNCGHDLYQNTSGQSKGIDGEPIISLDQSSKRKIVNVILFIFIGIFFLSFCIVAFLLAFKWNIITNVFYDDNNNSVFGMFILLPVGYLLGIIIISNLFKSMKASKIFLQITFIVSIILIIPLILHILHTGVNIIFGRKALEIFVYYYPWYDGLFTEELILEARIALLIKGLYLLANLIAYVAFVLVILSRYFKKQSLDLKSGLQSLIKSRTLAHYINIIKQLE